MPCYLVQLSGGQLSSPKGSFQLHARVWSAPKSAPLCAEAISRTVVSLRRCRCSFEVPPKANAKRFVKKIVLSEGAKLGVPAG
jgi:hypothetical protein